MFKKGAFTFILAVLIIIGLTATSFANPGKGNADWKDNGNGKKVQFNDIGSDSDWANPAILNLHSRGMISGYPDLAFRPNVPISKYEALMMIWALDKDFDSVMAMSWEDRQEECLDYAAGKGIDVEDFEGWKPAKRHEIAVWAMKAMDLDIYNEGLPFLDINDIPEDARPYISMMFKHKYMVGYPDKKFQPNKPVTRAEMAVIIFNIMGDWPEYDGYDDQSDLEKDLLVDYGELNGIEIEDINLKGNEDKVNVKIEINLEDSGDKDKWEELEENEEANGDIEDWLDGFVEFIQDNLSEDTEVKGTIVDIDNNEVLVKFSKDGNDDLEFDFYDSEVSSEASVVEEDLHGDSYNVRGLDFKVTDISYDEGDEEVSVELKADEDIAAEWAALDYDDEIKDEVKSICKDIAEAFDDEGFYVETVLIEFLNKDDDGLDSYDYDVSSNVLS